MVENTAPENQQDLAERISIEWANMVSNQSEAAKFIEGSQKKPLDGLSLFAFFNNKLDINRFFIEEGEGADTPQVGFSEKKDGDEAKVEDDLFEDALDNALCVFKSSGANTDMLKDNEKQILFYVDLENEEIIDKETIMAQKEEGEEDQEKGIDEKPHPMLFNQYPLCRDHSLLLLFAEEGLPQILSDELMSLLLQLFKISNKSQLRIGYNSMGADCIINNLHFHVMNTDSLFGEGIEMFPIELADKAAFFKTSLKHKSSEEINMYNCGIRFGEVVGWPMQALLISPEIESDETSLEDAQEALAHCAGVVLNYLIEGNIPHNILVADEGMTLYIIPRKFDMLIENVQFFTSFESLCGFVKFKTQQAYESANTADISKLLSEQVSMTKEEFTNLKNALVTKFLTEYEGQRVDETGAQEAGTQEVNGTAEIEKQTADLKL